MLSFRNEDNAVRLEGRLDEKMDQQAISDLAALIEQCFRHTQKPVALHVAGLDGGNSSGVVKWLRAMDRIKIPIVYHEVPVWLTEQFSEIVDFFRGDVDVHSVCARYCRQDDAESTITRVLVMGRDIPFIKDYMDYEVPNIEENGKVYEPDFSGDYFFFMTLLPRGARPVKLR